MRLCGGLRGLEVKVDGFVVGLVINIFSIEVVIKCVGVILV